MDWEFLLVTKICLMLEGNDVETFPLFKNPALGFYCPGVVC